MYDVIYIDSHGDETPLAQHLANRSDAAEVAHSCARRTRSAGCASQPLPALLPSRCRGVSPYVASSLIYDEAKAVLGFAVEIRPATAEVSI